MFKRPLAALGLILSGLFSPATWAVDDGAHLGHGTVKSVDVSAGRLTIDHEDIPGLMMGMTMEFSVSDPEVLRGIAPGQTIDFEVRRDGDRYVVTEIRPLAAGESSSDQGKMRGDGDCC